MPRGARLSSRLHRRAPGLCLSGAATRPTRRAGLPAPARAPASGRAGTARSRRSPDSARSKRDQRLAVLEALLEPVERPELAAQVVDRVHDGGLAGARHHGAPVLERAVVGEHDVEHRARQLGRKAVDPLDRAAHHVVAERDLAQELALVGEVDRHRVGLVGLDLPDVVDQPAGDSEVAVDAGEGARHRADGLAHGQRVLEQPVQVGLVVVLRRRRAPETLPHRGAARRSGRRAASPATGCAPCRSAAAGRPPSARRWRPGRPSGRRAGSRRPARATPTSARAGARSAATPRSGRAPAARCRAARSRAPRRRRPRRWPPACRCSRTASGADSPRRCAAGRARSP